jgi:hypothetical protein
MKLLRDQFKFIEKKSNTNKNLLNPYTFNRNNYKNDSKEKKNNLNFSDNNNYSINNTNINNQIHSSYNSNIQNIQDNKNENQDDLYNDYVNINILWQDLGVTENYKLIFDSLSKDIDPIMKQDLFESELDSLGKFSELLIVK